MVAAHRLDRTWTPRMVPSCYDNGCAATMGIGSCTTSWLTLVPRAECSLDPCYLCWLSSGPSSGPTLPSATVPGSFRDDVAQECAPRDQVPPGKQKGWYHSLSLSESIPGKLIESESAMIRRPLIFFSTTRRKRRRSRARIIVYDFSGKRWRDGTKLAFLSSEDRLCNPRCLHNRKSKSRGLNANGSPSSETRDARAQQSSEDSFRNFLRGISFTK